VRARQHVNTLSAAFAEPPEIDWLDALPLACAPASAEAPPRPMHVDLGCADATVIAELARHNPGWDFLGLEVREPVVAIAKRRLEAAGVLGRNAAVVRCNPQLTGTELLASLREATGRRRFLSSAAVQHPDPCFKRRHARRRVLTPPLLAALAEHMLPGAPLLLQTDVVDAMRAMLHACAHRTLRGRLALAALVTTRYDGGRGSSVTPQGLAPVGGAEGGQQALEWFGAASTPRERAVAGPHGGGFISRAVLVWGEDPRAAVGAEAVSPARGDSRTDADGAVVRMAWGGTVPCVPLAAAFSIEPATAFPWQLPAEAPLVSLREVDRPRCE